jgi:hypothetical protein
VLGAARVRPRRLVMARIVNCILKIVWWLFEARNDGWDMEARLAVK